MGGMRFCQLYRFEVGELIFGLRVAFEVALLVVLALGSRRWNG